MAKMKKCLTALVSALFVVSAIGFASCGDKECKHNWGEWKVTAATCSKEGEKTRECAKCKVQDKIVLKKDSEAHDWVKDDAKSKAPTCKTAGSEAFKCQNKDKDGKVCTSTKSESIATLPHVESENRIYETCEVDGRLEYKCATIFYDDKGNASKCGATTKTSKTIEKSGHEWKWDAEKKVNYCEGHFVGDKPIGCYTYDLVKGTYTQAFSSAGLEYQYDATLRGFVVVGIGDCTSTSIYIPSRYDDGKIEAPVVAIDGAFKDFDNITRLEIISCDGYGVEKILDGALSDCKNLKEVVLGDSVVAIGSQETDNEKLKGVLSNCAALADIKWSNNLKVIGIKSFEGCTKLTEVEIPSSIQAIEKNAFRGCTSLKSVKIGVNTSMELSTEQGATIGEYAFSGCTSLETIELGEGITTLGSYIFKDCSKFTKIVIPDSVTEIMEYAFYKCTGLQKVEIGVGSNLKTIYQYVFSGCSNLGEICIPNELTTIQAGAFSETPKLEKVNIDSLEHWVTIKFETGNANPLWNGQAKLYLRDANGNVQATPLTDIVIDGGDTICQHAFINYSALTKVTIGESVTNIGVNAFYHCNNLKEVIFNAKECIDCHPKGAFMYAGAVSGIKLTVGKNVTRIPAYLFSADCHEDSATLTTISFVECDDADCAKPDVTCTHQNSCKEIGRYAFAQCDELKKVTFGSNVNKVGEAAFYNCKNLNQLTLSDVEWSGDMIATKAFSGCNVYVATMPASAVKYISQKELRKVVVLSGNIEAKAFESCNNLVRVEIKKEVTDIGEYAFANCGKLWGVFFEKTEVAETVSAAGVMIGKYAFLNCTALGGDITDETKKDYQNKVGTWTSETGGITLNDNVKSIGDYAFYNCTSLKNVDTKAVNTIGNYAFKNCKAIASMVISLNMTSIGARAFEGCTALKEVYFNSRLNWTIVGVTEEGKYEWTTDLAEKNTAADFLTNKYVEYVWTREE